MKKILFIACLLACSSLQALAQEIKTEREVVRVDTIKIDYTSRYYSKFWDNWFIEPMVGTSILFAEEDSHLKFKNRLAPAFQIGIGKEVIPDLTLRLTAGYSLMKGWNSGIGGLYKQKADWEEYDPVQAYLEKKGQDCSNGYKERLSILNIGADLMLDLWNMWTPYDKVNRVWSPYLVAGGEYIAMLKYHGSYNAHKVGFRAGVKVDVNLSTHFGLTGEVMGHLTDATFDNQIGKGHKTDGFVTALVGIKFRPGRQGFRPDRLISRDQYQYLQGAVKQVNEDYNETILPEAIIGATAGTSTLFAPSIVFDDNKDTYSEELQMVNLYRMAKYMNQNPRLKVSVIGNTHSVDKNLARKRAEIIRNVLINRYGIQTSRLSVDLMDVNAEYHVSGNDQSVNFGVGR